VTARENHKYTGQGIMGRSLNLRKEQTTETQIGKLSKCDHMVLFWKNKQAIAHRRAVMCLKTRIRDSQRLCNRKHLVVGGGEVALLLRVASKTYL
jgi:hypothetical protein